ncbi:MAG: hypothetical protein LKI03_02635 [Acetobacter indonesiensis]|jgi:hypothetical protein|uniref:hypothetical protein n=1 Tax=Acetobacter indonesiensis TaxID=104101 RepID=UPI0020A30023|nr:hypothetical protein [Acetobacter indonesiensis]MCI1438549.1 hypothetical protein [Acetobacter indonesiensis]MCI1546526.1 hypothetical protein [Acetobacter indonesiensis]MCI1764931.1 hypothetical protein [Acetobacter indonesiensis]MCP1230299.1 hypothetical protein [Acetobacter indonesiensis]
MSIRLLRRVGVDVPSPVRVADQVRFVVKRVYADFISCWGNPAKRLLALAHNSPVFHVQGVRSDARLKQAE